MPRILIVDDIKPLAEQYAYDLRRLGDFETSIALSGDAALETLKAEAVDCMILDLEMPGLDGFGVLRALREAGIELPVIVYTGTGDFDRCVRAVKLGAFGFIDKDEPMQRVVREVENALQHGRMKEEVDALRARLGGTELIGDSPPMQDLKAKLKRLGPIPSAVLIVGESGSGKELVARELHQAGRADGPFVPVNAGALPENLVESELFGHERGAFTGADRVHQGAFERAANGTIFLDEIGELDAAAQAKLLRVLENRQFTRVGGEKPIAMTARVVAATHRDLDADARDGHFRTDLLFRLNTHVLRVPPLRERRSDIPRIANALLGATCRTFGLGSRSFSEEAMRALVSRDWDRNNVRELRNAIERMVIAADGPVIGSDGIPSEWGAHSPEAPASFADRKREAERAIIVQALEAHDWHISNTARALGLADHASLLKIMRRLDVSSN